MQRMTPYEEKDPGTQTQRGEEKLVVEAVAEKEKESKKSEDKVDEMTETAESLAELSRSERKRCREKKRRSDVNHGLDQMMALVFLIDPQLKAEAEERARKNHGTRSTANSESSLLSRVELINSAVATLERIHSENESNKLIITHLSRGLLSNGAGGSLPAAPAPAPPAIPPHLLAALSAQRNIQNLQRQELQQQLNLEALIAASGSSLRNDPTNMGACPAPSSDQSATLGGSNAVGAAALLQGLERDGLGGNAAIYQALLNQKIKDGEDAILAAARLGGAGGSLPGGASALNPGAASLLGSINPALLARSAQMMGSSAPLSGQQPAVREQTIAEAAAARTHGVKLSDIIETKEDGSPSNKRFKPLDGR